MITSVHNPKIQAVRKLQTQAKGAVRSRHSSLRECAWRRKPCRERGKRGWYCYTDVLDERGKAVVDGFSARGTPAEQVSEAVMKAISETETPQGLLVVLT